MRHRSGGVEPATRAIGMEQFLVRARVAPMRQRRGVGDWDAARAQVLEFSDRGDWSGATPLHFVALYAALFRTVYGLDCAEVENTRIRAQAVAAAGQMLRDSFRDDPDAMLLFVRWSWKQECEREDWRRRNKRQGGTLGWRLQFSPKLLDEYRIGVMRAGES
jgi:hypothetical protein